MVKDAIEQHVQKTYHHGLDIAMSLRDMKKWDLSSFRPDREEATIDDQTDLAKIREAKIKQDSFDIVYQEELKLYLE